MLPILLEPRAPLEFRLKPGTHQKTKSAKLKTQNLRGLSELVASISTRLRREAADALNQGDSGKGTKGLVKTKRVLTAVCALMWVQPTILAFLSGLSSPARRRNAIIPGISERQTFSLEQNKLKTS